MDGMIDYLENLNLERRPWRIHVRAIRIWEQPSYFKDSCLGDCLEIVVVNQRVRHSLFQFSTNSYLCNFGKLRFIRFLHLPYRIQVFLFEFNFLDMPQIDVYSIFCKMMYKQFLGYARTWGLFVWIQCLGYANSIFRHIISMHLRHDASMTTNVVVWYLQGTRVQATINSYHVTNLHYPQTRLLCVYNFLDEVSIFLFDWSVHFSTAWYLIPFGICFTWRTISLYSFFW